MLDPFIHHLQIPVEAFQIVLIIMLTGMVRPYQLRYLLHILFLQQIFIIIVGRIILFLLPLLVVELLVQISFQFHLLVKGLRGQVLICQDLDLLCILSSLVTGMAWWIVAVSCVIHLCFSFQMLISCVGRLSLYYR